MQLKLLHMSVSKMIIGLPNVSWHCPYILSPGEYSDYLDVATVMFVDGKTNSNTGRHCVFYECVLFHLESIILNEN